jgi:hypothetical protein
MAVQSYEISSYKTEAHPHSAGTVSLLAAADAVQCSSAKLQQC